MLLMMAALFAFWILLSGKFDAFHLALGALSAAATTWSARSLWRLAPTLDDARLPRWRRWPSYLLWLSREVIVSSVQVALVVLDPRMPAAPSVFRFRRRLPGPLAHLVFANSITLTPGTIVLDFEQDEYVVHALTEKAALAADAQDREGEMSRRVAALFEATGA